MAGEADPLYQRIRRSVRDGIASGRFGAGSRLPSEMELAQSFGTTRTTVRHALSELVFEGVLVRRNGSGSFVTDAAVIRSPIDSRRCLTFEEQVALAGQEVTYGSSSLAQATATENVAACLRIPPGSAVFRLERLRLIENRPVCLEERFFPPNIGQHVTGRMLLTQSAHRFTTEILGEPVPSIVVSITAECAEPPLAAKLAIAPSSAVIVRDNTHHTGAGLTVSCGRSVFRGDVRTEYVLGRPITP